jgi:hypothetical protein
MRLFLLFVITLSGAATTLAAEPAGQEFMHSDLCGTCHRDIYQMWSESMHSQSMENPTFLQSFRHGQAMLGEQASRVCLTCHAPSVLVSEDWGLDERITWEGVTCDVCHSLSQVNLSGHGPRMVLEPGPVKRGPIHDAVSTGHETAYSELHTTSLVCAGCHEYVNQEGTPIMTTFSEWRESSARERGTNCQTCHMGVTRANVVDPQVKRLPDVPVNLHQVPGGHSLEQLYKALRVRFDIIRVGDELTVDVGITNKGAGHAVPTGMPNRRIILSVELDAGQGGQSEERRVYAKSFVDASGQPIDDVWGYFMPGARPASDTRIPTDGEQNETFRFPLSASLIAYLTVRLEYEHMSEDPDGKSRIFTFYSERRMLKPDAD